MKRRIALGVCTLAVTPFGLSGYFGSAVAGRAGGVQSNAARTRALKRIGCARHIINPLTKERHIMKTLTQSVLVCIMLLSLPMNLHAWEPNTGDLDKAIKAGDFTEYLTNISAWLNKKVPANPGDISEAAMKALLREPVFVNTLDQRQLISKLGVANIGAFARVDRDNRTFLGWLLRNTQAMDLYLEGATPTGIKKRELDSYTLPVASLDLWNKVLKADPDSRKGIYLRLAIATAISPPPAKSYGSGVPIDPVDRYKLFKSAHKNDELFPIFDPLTVWEYRKIVADWASDSDLTWVRNMVNTWRPDLRINQRVMKIVSEVWRRNSPYYPYVHGFVTVMEGGGKCGPRSWFGRMTCRAFGIPSVGVGAPGHACMAYKTADGWKTAYAPAWHRLKCEGVSGPEFLAEVDARSRATQFSQVEHLRWLASTLASKNRAAAVMRVARKLQQSAPEPELKPKPIPSKAPPASASKPEAPFKVVPGVMHVEAESYSKMSGIKVYDCFTGGKQVNFQKNMKSSWMDYTIDVPATGIYGMKMRTATPNREQVLEISSQAKKLATVKIPNTRGLWGTTQEVNIRLNKGIETLRLSAPYQRGIAIRWFELKSK